MKCIFVTDLHGIKKRFAKLFEIIKKEKPDGVFIGGDILPNQYSIEKDMKTFLQNNVFTEIEKIKDIANKKTCFFVIMGNDDPRVFEKHFIQADKKNIIHYVNEKTAEFNDLFVTGYSYVPPTPFQLKDWEKYDVSRFVDVGSVSPEKGMRTVEVNKDAMRFCTIKEDLKKLSRKTPMDKTIFLFHTPPYDTKLDRASLDGKKVDHAPMDVHVGSIAVKKFIEKNQPLVTLHGHVHESVDITGIWKEKIKKTMAFSAAHHNREELALVRFDTDNLKDAEREIIKV